MTEIHELIVLESIYKYHYTDTLETSALSNFSLKIKRGEFVSIMGPSGSGKSTLLNIIGMIDVITKGRYFFDGFPVHKLSESRRTHLRKGNISFIFQSFNLIDELTAYENIELPLLYLGLKPDERKKRIDSVLLNLEMTHRRDHYPQQLSGGQQQRIAIARAVVTRPQLILADEPTGNLDSKNSEMVMGLLQDLHKSGSTILMVTHSEHDSTYAERRLKLFDGQLLENELKPIL